MVFLKARSCSFSLVTALHVVPRWRTGEYVWILRFYYIRLICVCCVCLDSGRPSQWPEPSWMLFRRWQTWQLAPEVRKKTNTPTVTLAKHQIVFSLVGWDENQVEVGEICFVFVSGCFFHHVSEGRKMFSFKLFFLPTVLSLSAFPFLFLNGEITRKPISFINGVCMCARVCVWLRNQKGLCYWRMKQARKITKSILSAYSLSCFIIQSSLFLCIFYLLLIMFFVSSWLSYWTELTQLSVFLVNTLLLCSEQDTTLSNIEVKPLDVTTWIDSLSQHFLNTQSSWATGSICEILIRNHEDLCGATVFKPFAIVF